MFDRASESAGAGVTDEAAESTVGRPATGPVQTLRCDCSRRSLARRGAYFLFCRASDGGGCRSGLDDDGWWRLDDSSAVPMTTVGRPHRPTEAAYTLLYRLVESSSTDDRPLPALTTLPGPLRAALTETMLCTDGPASRGHAHGAEWPAIAEHQLLWQQRSSWAAVCLSTSAWSVPRGSGAGKDSATGGTCPPPNIVHF